MLKIYSGRENIDKEKFIYENIKGETFVIVPDQYTLAAERQALKYMKEDCLFDVEIVSINRLGSRILREKGYENLSLINKYGRFMLLSKIISDNSEKFEIFKNSVNKSTFIEMVNDFISSFKQYDCTAEDLKILTENECGSEILRTKLSELSLILQEYEEAIRGKYTDSEDFVSLYTEAITESALIKGKDIWIYGFDTVTAKFMDTVINLSKYAKNVNFIINRSDYNLDGILIRRLISEAEKRGIETYQKEIINEYIKEKNETLKRIEMDLFSSNKEAIEKNREFKPEGLSIYECANPYYEAETAASYIQKLLRDEDYRMKDIAVVCNDEENMVPVLKRIFEEYSLPVFIDSRQTVSDSPAAVFVVRQLEFIFNGYRTSSIISMLKSGFSDTTDEENEFIENYTKKYFIKGNMWAKPFVYGAYEYSVDDFTRLENIRKRVTKPLFQLEQIIKNADSVSDFTEKFSNYLDDEWNLREKVENIVEKKTSEGFPEAAQRIAVGYNAVMEILEQIIKIIGDSEMKIGEYLTIFKEGLENIDMGMIPPSLDGITVGTMIRSRTADIRAVVVVGANEGILPLEPSSEGLFSIQEKEFFSKHNFPLGVLDDIKMLEEETAMYRTLSKASEKVFISYSMTDTAGKEMKPSSLIDSIRIMFPKIHVQKDVVSRGFSLDIVNDRKETLRHLVNSIKESVSPSVTADGSVENIETEMIRTTFSWYAKFLPKETERMMKACLDGNEKKPIGKSTAKKLFAGKDGEFSFSSSRLEKYFKCPFSHFVMYGLKPYENREFKSGPREIGDVCHECIMKVSKKYLKEGSHADSFSKKEEIAETVSQELEKISKQYRGGLFVSAGREEYHMERIKKICTEAVSKLAEQMQKGSIKAAYFEESFGRRYLFKPVVLDVSGEMVYIEGRIDRVDITENNKVRIIDYKTGNDKPDIEEMRIGYRMQLMIYMKGVCETGYTPAGMFYINISENEIPVTGLRPDKTKKELDKAASRMFNLKGIYIDDDEIRKEMPIDIIDTKSKALKCIDFEELGKDVEKAAKEISRGIIEGEINIEPVKKRREDTSECTYCKFRSICRFDITNSKNKYRMV